MLHLRFSFHKLYRRQTHWMELLVPLQVVELLPFAGVLVAVQLLLVDPVQLLVVGLLQRVVFAPYQTWMTWFMLSYW